MGVLGVAGYRRYTTNGRMNKTIRKYASFDEMKADEYRYWQSRPVHERVAAVSELTEQVYALSISLSAPMPLRLRTTPRDQRPRHPGESRPGEPVPVRH